MQYINHWPDTAELTLPETVAQDLQHRLLEPFDSAGEAKAFWNESSSTLIILDPHDSIQSLKQDPVWNEIEFSLAYPEYTVPLNMGYQLSVTIKNDSGSANFLLIPPELAHIISEGVENP